MVGPGGVGHEPSLDPCQPSLWEIVGHPRFRPPAEGQNLRLDCQAMERRKRRKSYDTPHHAHALNFSVYRRRPHLMLSGVVEAFLRTVDLASQELGFEVWAYVVMPEHVHLVIHPVEEAYDMAAIQYAVKRRSAQAIFALHPGLREECRVPKRGRRDEFRLWQACGGYDQNFFTARATWAEIRYVHNNPVRRGLCESSLEWAWSSARAYAGGETPIPVDLCDWSLDG